METPQSGSIAPEAQSWYALIKRLLTISPNMPPPLCPIPVVFKLFAPQGWFLDQIKPCAPRSGLRDQCQLTKPHLLEALVAYTTHISQDQARDLAHWAWDSTHLEVWQQESYSCQISIPMISPVGQMTQCRGPHLPCGLEGEHLCPILILALPQPYSL